MASRSVAVVGPGAIGVAVAGGLAHLSPMLCGRRPLGAQRVVRPSGTVSLGPVVADPVSADGPVDWVLLATKAHQSEGAQGWLDVLCGPSTVVAVLQNGIDHVARIQPLVPRSTVLPVVVLLAADRDDEVSVHQRGRGRLTVPSGSAGEAFAALFPEGDLVAVKVVEDFVTQAWWKLVMNAAVGAVAALTIRDNGVLSDPGVGELLLAIMDEVMEVGRAEGALLDRPAAERAVASAQAAGHHWSSIAADRRAGRALEWQARNEVVCRLARRHGIATPLNDAFTTLLRATDPGSR